jgi:hypothetical protein
MFAAPPLEVTDEEREELEPHCSFFFSLASGRAPG